MKILFSILCLMSLAFIANAQPPDHISFYLSITDTAEIQSVTPNAGDTTYTINCNDTDIEEIFANYTIYKLYAAFPSSNYRLLRRMYYIECNSDSLFTELHNEDSLLFPFHQIISESYTLSSCPPNDLGQVGSQDYLTYIQADSAWCITHGNPNVKIGIYDGGYLNVNHEEFSGAGYNQIAAVLANSISGYTIPPPQPAHPTIVSGFAAGKTNNDTGLAAIGYNCRLIYKLWPDHNKAIPSDWLDIANAGAKIINGSYSGALQNNKRPPLYTTTIFNPGYYLWRAEQLAAFELYEDDISLVFSAGNGYSKNDVGTVIGHPWDYNIPASLDYVLSVTSVGSQNTTGTYNLKDRHKYELADLTDTSSHTHNSRVDICAPGISLHSLDYDPSNSSVLYNVGFGAKGTSFSAPIVSGTIGLMLSAKPCLSAYQREYILKTTANNGMLSLSDNADYAGGLGFGRLDAGSAVNVARYYNCNNEQTKTMVIRNIELSTYCATSVLQTYFPNDTPYFKNMIIENGTPPYTYRWDVIGGGNNADLSCTDCQYPRIIQDISPAEIMLTVTDASSPVPKVASKIIAFTAKLGATPDLAMKDGYSDHFMEPNDMEIVDKHEWDYWKAPDLWNRTYNDAGTKHQNPEYVTPYSTPTSYIKTRIRNIGCTTSYARERLHLYWSKAGTGQQWPAKWINYSIGGIAMGDEITISSGDSIPPLDPGDEIVMTHAWTSPMPANYDLADFHFCLLARIEDTAVARLGMTTLEGTDAYQNIKNNNNIVTRNMVSVILYPDRGPDPDKLVQIGISGAETALGYYDLEFLNERSIRKNTSGDMSAVMTIKLELGTLYDVWQANGGLGNYTSKDDNNKTVTFDCGTTPLRLNNIPLQGTDLYNINVVFMPNPESFEFDITNRWFHLRQFKDGQITGAVDFVVSLLDTNSVDSSAEKQSLSTSNFATSTTVESIYKLHPNPAKDIINIVASGSTKNISKLIITDISGRIVYEENSISLKNNTYEIKTSSLMAGVYFVKLTDSHGKIHSLKFAKVNQ